jgi:hypothetical protein
MSYNGKSSPTLTNPPGLKPPLDAGSLEYWMSLAVSAASRRLE